MKKYRKKPVVIEAIQYNGDNYNEILNFTGNKSLLSLKQSNEIIINTLEGNMIASIGDYIIKGIKGEFYPCKPDIFEQLLVYLCHQSPFDL